jgi:hypothetical protein
MSEQEDLPSSEYGCTISLPYYVFNCIRTVSGAELVYEPDYWGGLQDTFVVRRAAGHCAHRAVSWFPVGQFWNRLTRRNGSMVLRSAESGSLGAVTRAG